MDFGSRSRLRSKSYAWQARRALHSPVMRDFPLDLNFKCGSEPEVPAKPMPIAVNTIQNYEDLVRPTISSIPYGGDHSPISRPTPRFIHLGQIGPKDFL